MGMVVNPSRFASGGADVGLSTKWRIKCNRVINAGDAYFSLIELKMKDTLGGSNLCVGGTASASVSGQPPANAFDNDPATRYATGTSSMPQWLEYDFLTAVTIEQVLMTCYASTDLPSIFDVQYYDEDTSAWVTYWSFDTYLSGTSDAIQFPNGAERAYSNAAKTMWRVKINDVSGGGGSWTGIREIELRTTTGGSDVTSPTPNNGEGSFGSRNPQNTMLCFDDGVADYSAGSPSRPADIGWVFATPTDIVEMTLQATGSTGDAPNDFDLQYWNGTAWHQVANFTVPGGWSGGEVKTFTV